MAGLISMIPNVFPIIMIFGALGWLNIKVDIGIMMTASVALGVAVDDTVHFLTWFRRGVVQGLNRVDAVMLAYDRCATAMLQTTIIGGLGLAVFATSTFTPTQQFGYLMISMLGAALVGDLLLLPAILASPLGKFFGGDAPPENAVTVWGQSPTHNVVSPRAGTAPAIGIDSSSLDHAEITSDNTADDTSEVEATNRAGLPDQPREVPASSLEPDSAAAIQAARAAVQQQELLEGPHAALHAKLRSLRRDGSSRDSISP